jgi:hypothetical protein
MPEKSGVTGQQGIGLLHGMSANQKIGRYAFTWPLVACVSPHDARRF